MTNLPPLRTILRAMLPALLLPACLAAPAAAQQIPPRPMDEASMARLLKGEDGERVRRFAATAAVAAHCGRDPNPHVQALMRTLRTRPGRTEEQVGLLGTYGEAIAAEAQQALAKVPCDARMREELDRRIRQDLASLPR
jgi:hypothetical protein